MLHAVRLVATPGPDYAKQLILDYDRSILLCRMKSNAVTLVQLVAGSEQRSKVIEKIASKSKLAGLVWMNRMDCYADGSADGLIRLRDIAKEG